MWRSIRVIPPILALLVLVAPTLPAPVEATEALTFTTLWRAAIADNIGFSPNVGDIDGDGVVDVAVVGSDFPPVGTSATEKTVQAIRNDGTELWRRSALMMSGVVTLGDVDADGKEEVLVAGTTSNVCGSSQGIIHAFDDEGTKLWEYRDTADSGSCKINAGWPILADVDRDGKPDIIVSNRGFPNQRTYALRGIDGTELWQTTLNENSYVAFGDLTGDGVGEYVLFTNVDHKVFVLDIDGNLLWSFNTINYNTGALGDITGDGINDVVVSSSARELYSGDRVYALKNDGTVLWSTSLSFPISWPVLRDLDGDSVRDVIVGTGNQVTALKSDGQTRWTVNMGFQVHPVSLAEFDLDRDGAKELIVFNFGTSEIFEVSDSGVVSLRGALPNQASPTLTRRSLPDEGPLVVGDVNGDGFDELIVFEAIEGQTFVAAVSIGPSIALVDADIKPGSDPNSVDCKSGQGNVPVGIFGDDGFDAQNIDVPTLKLEGVPVAEIHGQLHPEDLDGDGDPDAVVHLDKADVCEATKDIPLQQSVTVTLTGQTNSGQRFEGTDTIRIVKR